MPTNVFLTPTPVFWTPTPEVLAYTTVYSEVVSAVMEPISSAIESRMDVSLVVGSSIFIPGALSRPLFLVLSTTVALGSLFSGFYITTSGEEG